MKLKAEQKTLETMLPIYLDCKTRLKLLMGGVTLAFLSRGQDTGFIE